MTIDENKTIARRVIEEIFVKQEPAAVDELVAEDFRPHDWGDVASGRQAMLDAMRRASAGLSEVRMRIEDMIAESHRVAVRLTSSAVQSGEFMGMPPSGARYEIPEIHIFRIRDGRVAEHWHQLDMLGLQRQLQEGSAPAEGGAAKGAAAAESEPKAVAGRP